MERVWRFDVGDHAVRVRLRKGLVHVEVIRFGMHSDDAMWREVTTFPPITDKLAADTIISACIDGSFPSWTHDQWAETITLATV